ncbi:MAG TPA: ArsA family ATPase [Vicinamibacterales bacterium]|nr:ArsA family ATPase [Vicinamibacterales bacterium]
MKGLLDRKVLFFGGKGGVGKTTCASATALEASRRGKRVLLVSTDPAHSTSDIFEQPFTAEEREIQPGLWGLEIDAAFEARRYIDQVKKQIGELFSPVILKEAAKQIELAATMPGVEEVALFDRMSELIVDRDDEYDLVVFDTAPTGHTLRLLQMPELMTSWMRALSKTRRAMLNEDAGSDPVLAALERRRERLQVVRARLMRAKVAAFVLVLIAERLPIEETARAIETLAGSDVHVLGLVVNRVLPDHLDGAFYTARRRQEQVYLDEIDRRFEALTRQRIPQFETDIHGLGQLEAVSRELVGAA